MTDATAPRTAACPLCGRPAEQRFRPFCSRRCADVDLSRWLGGVYRVTVDDPDADEVAPPPAKADDDP